MLVGIYTQLNSEELTWKYLEESIRVIWYSYQSWCKYCTYKLVYSSRTNDKEIRPYRIAYVLSDYFQRTGVS